MSITYDKAVLVRVLKNYYFPPIQPRRPVITLTRIYLLRNRKSLNSIATAGQ